MSVVLYASTANNDTKFPQMMHYLRILLVAADNVATFLDGWVFRLYLHSSAVSTIQDTGRRELQQLFSAFVATPNTEVYGQKPQLPRTAAEVE